MTVTVFLNIYFILTGKAIMILLKEINKAQYKRLSLNNKQYNSDLYNFDMVPKADIQTIQLCLAGS
jgi:hypothetical protein